MELEKAAKEYLGQAIVLDQEIESKIMTLQKMRALATRTTTVLSGNFSSGNNAKGLEETIAKIVDMEREINADIDRLVDLKREIMEILKQVPDDTCRVFLEKRYLENKTGYEIADEMYYSRPWAKYCHKKGLAMVGEILLKIGKLQETYP